MIVNLLGPPGVGKSTFASRFVLEHPYYKYLSIDACRIATYQAGLSQVHCEREAWKMLYYGMRYAKDCVVESVGLDWRLAKIFEVFKHRPRINIAFVGNGQEIEQRLRDRQHKRPLPFPYEKQDEIDTIYYVLDELDKNKAPVDYYVSTTGRTENQIYEIVVPQITNFRLKAGNNHGVHK